MFCRNCLVRTEQEKFKMCFCQLSAAVKNRSIKSVVKTLLLHKYDNRRNYSPIQWVWSSDKTNPT